MRIHVLFANAMSVLVPCGDGKITIRELIENATIRFGKILTEKVSLWISSTHFVIISEIK